MEQVKRPANIILNKPKTNLYCFQTFVVIIKKEDRNGGKKGKRIFNLLNFPLSLLPTE